MNCDETRAALLQALDESQPADQLAGLRLHVAGCVQCQRFDAAQRALDRRLHTLLTPPEMSRSFRADLRRKIRTEATPAWPAALPDAMHFVTCGVTTLLSAVVLPFDPASTLTAGAVATLAVYVLLTAVRDALEVADSRA